MRAYKITDVNDRTYHGFQWHEGMIHKTNGSGGLCTLGWIHFYKDKRLAVLLNPIHGKYNPFHLWLGEAGGKIEGDNGLKWGCTEFRMIKRVRAPKITLTQRVAFAILCSLEVYSKSRYVKWAEDWLKNKDRTAKAAQEAARTTWTVAREIREATWAAAARGERIVAQEAAWAAAKAAEAAQEAEVTVKNKNIAEAALWAAKVAGEARINLVSLVTECLKY